MIKDLIKHHISNALLRYYTGSTKCHQVYIFLRIKIPKLIFKKHIGQNYTILCYRTRTEIVSWFW